MVNVAAEVLLGVILVAVPACSRHDWVRKSTIPNYSSPVNQVAGCAHCAKLALDGFIVEMWQSVDGEEEIRADVSDDENNCVDKTQTKCWHII